MSINVNQNNPTTNKLLSAIVFLWFIYACTYSLLKYTPNTILLSGYLPLIGEAGLDIFLAVLLFNHCYKTNSSNNKKLFLLFFLSSVTATFADGIYNIVLNSCGFKYVNPIIICMFELPFLLFLLFQAIAWGYILYINTERSRKFNTSCYLP